MRSRASEKPPHRTTQTSDGPKELADLRKHKVGEKAIAVSPNSFCNGDETPAASQAVMRERMEALSPEEFQDLLRPCFPG